MNLLKIAKNIESIIDCDTIGSDLKNALCKATMVKHGVKNLHSKAFKSCYRGLTGVHVTDNHNGKMEFLASISTSCKCNANCLARIKNNSSICSECYAQSQLSCYKNQAKVLENNTKLLTAGIIKDYVPNLSMFKYFRFEAFGDLNNVVQFLNYYIIAKHNPSTFFTLWTKNDWIVFAAFYIFNLDFLDNFFVIGSSEQKNVVKDFRYNPCIDGSFTVFTIDYLETHPNIKINCGANDCFGCHNCYQFHNEYFEIHELLKKEQTENNFKLLENN